MQNANARLQAATSASRRAQQHLLELLQKRTRPVQLTPGDRVWMSSAHVALAVPYKLTPRWLGPYRVLTVDGNNVRLALPASLGRRSPVVPWTDYAAITRAIHCSALQSYSHPRCSQTPPATPTIP